MESVLALLNFVFSGFWVWLGTVILLAVFSSVVCGIFCGFISFLMAAIRGPSRPVCNCNQGKKVPPESSNN